MLSKALLTLTLTLTLTLALTLGPRGLAARASMDGGMSFIRHGSCSHLNRELVLCLCR